MTIEWGEVNGKCRSCDTETVLVTADWWRTHPAQHFAAEDVEPKGEVSGHYCPTCNRLTAIFLNGQRLDAQH